MLQLTQSVPVGQLPPVAVSSASTALDCEALGINGTVTVSVLLTASSVLSCTSTTIPDD